MKHSRLLKLFGVFVLAAAFIVGCNKDEASIAEAQKLETGDDKLITYQGSQVIPGQYIVVLKKDEISDNCSASSRHAGH